MVEAKHVSGCQLSCMLPLDVWMQAVCRAMHIIAPEVMVANVVMPLRTSRNDTLRKGCLVVYDFGIRERDTGGAASA
jgi:hypothetical protein